jgi:hypothetical protein
MWRNIREEASVTSPSPVRNPVSVKILGRALERRSPQPISKASDIHSPVRVALAFPRRLATVLRVVTAAFYYHVAMLPLLPVTLGEAI